MGERLLQKAAPRTGDGRIIGKRRHLFLDLFQTETKICGRRLPRAAAKTFGIEEIRIHQRGKHHADPERDLFLHSFRIGRQSDPKRRLCERARRKLIPVGGIVLCFPLFTSRKRRRIGRIELCSHIGKPPMVSRNAVICSEETVFRTFHCPANGMLHLKRTLTADTSLEIFLILSDIVQKTEIAGICFFAP